MISRKTSVKTIFSPRRPLACLSMRHRVAARRRLEGHGDEPAQGGPKGTMIKNERVLADLQNKQNLRFVA